MMLPMMFSCRLKKATEGAWDDARRHVNQESGPDLFQMSFFGPQPWSKAKKLGEKQSLVFFRAGVYCSTAEGKDNI